MSTIARRYWIGVASADHVRRGRAEGFMQLCHGKAAPLKRIKPGDGIVYYSSVQRFGGTDRLQAFTAIGDVAPGEPYQVDMTPGFHPFRRDVRWHAAREAPIAPLLDRLSFTAGKRHWGYPFRFGIFEITPQDWDLIASAMASGAAGLTAPERGRAHSMQTLGPSLSNLR